MSADDADDTRSDVQEPGHGAEGTRPHDEQDAPGESPWAAEEARQDSDMTIGTRAAAELPDTTEGG